MQVKIKLIFEDRVGVVADISRVVAGMDMNIKSIEVVVKKGLANVFAEIHSIRSIDAIRQLFKSLVRIPHILDIKFINTLPREESENRFKTILDNMSDGIISIDAYGRMQTINKVAAQMYTGGDQDVIGRSIKDIIPGDVDLLKCLSGGEFEDVKKIISTTKGNMHFFSSVKKICDVRGRVLGAVQISKDIKTIRTLAKTLSNKDEIDFYSIIGQHPAILNSIRMAQTISKTDSIISIQGASGTGKELFARAIHTESGRQGPFVALNCAALPEQLLESELFGYERGAFTGGKREGKLGLFEVAREGTVFLDEIGDMPLSSQVKILRVLQENKVRRIGGENEVPISARIITATNRDLGREVEKKRFRRDLYYRINILPLYIPSLRDRMSDLPLLAKYFLDCLKAKLDIPCHSFSQEAMDKLYNHDWPGNVREVKNVVERAAILCKKSFIQDEFILFSHELQGNSSFDGIQDSEKVLSGGLRKEVADFEKALLQKALEANLSIRKTARSLGVSHTTLLNKIKKYNIEWNENEPLE
ncbi:sigma 54-interacting transcriptional regulator [Desulfovibrio inopinatus]|uniref:sigma 54-interacting transcriptional regulator n=1 Tax=Desulfovibrio inopinatus TaxID=102109 RepID=UPI00040388D4|nr:sigma 54-interacting transcriptional regulator [Desulfovibrio inopinatus]